jgi:hypothetical protein
MMYQKESLERSLVDLAKKSLPSEKKEIDNERR